MEDFYKILKKKVLVGDGAMGTTLQNKGMQSGEVPEEWNISKPQVIEDIHKSFIDAGSDMLITNTFGASPFKLQMGKLTEKLDYINKKAAEVALKAADDKAYVFADLGPSGKLVKPYGDIEFDELVDNFKQQIQSLKDTGIHGFIIETMTDINEVEAVLKTIKESSSLPVITSMSFKMMQNGDYRTIMGTKIEDLIDKVLEYGYFVVGANCGNTAKEMVGLAKEFSHKLTDYKEDIYLIVQPNAGIPVVENQKAYFEESPQDFIDIVPEFLQQNANIIGGCCGTTPEHIKVIKNMVDELNKIKEVERG